MNIKRFKRGVVLGVTILTICALGVPAVFAQVAQTPLPGSAIPQFVDPLPGLDVIVDPGIATPGAQIELDSKEFQTKVLPNSFYTALPAPYKDGTYVWGYLQPGQASRASYIGPVIVAQRGSPTEVKWVNDLGNADPYNAGLANPSQLLAYTQSTDQTLHWADPYGKGMFMGTCNIPPILGVDDPQCFNYAGPIPDVTHLHGGEVPPQIDGGPDAWYTSDGAYHGPAYYAGLGGGGNSTIFRYPNSQEAAPIWFHPHPLGVTRLNVYAGLAGAYLLTDPPNDPANLPELVPLVIQDRMFDTNGQLYFPNIGINPEHPYWIPEFVGDTIVVNGKVWPFKQLEAKRYSFLFLNGSNARTYEMFLQSQTTGAMVPMYVIATDGGYLDAPVKLDPALGQKLVLMPGERYEVIVDFGGFATQTLLLRNTGRTPFPKGAPPQGSTLGRIIQFRVIAATAPDTSYDPASGTPLRTAMVRLPGTPNGPGIVTTPGLTQNVQVTRQLTLNEVIGPGGPLEILVNNTKWNGISSDTTAFPDGIRPDFTPDSIGNYLSETPTEGQTEVWEIVNITADAHPIHLHLVQFQLINRQNFNTNKYNKVYNAAFGAGGFIPAYGPPNTYNTPNADGAVGGNPAIGPYLQGPVQPPLPQEAGWKDTTVMYPGQVTRIAVRFAPTDLDFGLDPWEYAYPFSPTGADYVWHCHILDHEDNEMMRPYQVIKNPSPLVSRTYIIGTDY